MKQPREVLRSCTELLSFFFSFFFSFFLFSFLFDSESGCWWLQVSHCNYVGELRILLKYTAFVGYNMFRYYHVSEVFDIREQQRKKLFDVTEFSTHK